MAGEGRRAGGRPALGAVVHLPPRPAPPGAARRLGRRARPADRSSCTGTYPCTASRVWGEPDAEDVLRRINGYHLDTGELVGDYRELRADGSTSSGCWIYSRGVQGRGEPLRPPRRRPRRQVGLVLAAGPPRALQPRLGRSRRAGRGASARSWSGGTTTPGRWVGDDIPDFPDDLPPGHVPPPDAVGAGRAARRRPVRPAGRRQGLAVRAQRRGRRAPADALRARRVAGAQPAARAAGQPDPPALRAPRPTRPTPRATPGVPVRPHLVPAHRAPTPRAAMTRWLPFLAELQPELFVEVSPQLAAERGLCTGSGATSSPAARRCRRGAVVTERIRAAAGAGPGGAPGVDALPLRQRRPGHAAT